MTKPQRLQSNEMYGRPKLNQSERQSDCHRVSESDSQWRGQPLDEERIVRVLAAGLQHEYDGNRRNGSRVAQERLSKKIIENAKGWGLFLDRESLKDLGVKRKKPSRESEIYFNYDSKIVTKIKNPMALLPLKGGQHADRVIYEHLVHNAYFPATSYHLKGVTEVKGEMRLILEQLYVTSYRNATEKEISSYMRLKGFKLSKKQKYTWTNGAISITDLEGDNVLIEYPRFPIIVD